MAPSAESCKLYFRLARVLMIGLSGRCSRGSSILTTAHRGSFLDNLLLLTALEQLQRGGTSKDRLRLLQPAHLGQIAYGKDCQNSSKAVNDTIGAIWVELP